MKIGFLTPEYPSNRIKSSAGIGTSLKNLAEGLVNSRIQVFIFIPYQDHSEEFTENGIHFIKIKNKKFRFFNWYFKRKFVEKQINSFIEHHSINILEVPDWTGMSAFMNFKIPHITRLHGTDRYFCRLEGRKQSFKNYFFEKMALDKSSAYIAPTKFAGTKTRELFDLDSKKITTIHYGLNLKHFINSNPEDYYQNRLLYFGTIIRKKGVFDLVKIFEIVLKKNPKAELILIGKDVPDVLTGKTSTYELLKRETPEAVFNQIVFLEELPYNELQNEIKKAHVCVFPSLAETLGMVTIESMALNKPVVNSDFGWTEQLIQDGSSGFRIDPKNHELFADKICELLIDRELCLKMGISARKHIEINFDMNIIVNMNINFYRQVLTD